MIWWILLSLFTFLLLTLLFAPLKLSLSTANNLYFISWGNVLKASFSILEDDISLGFHLFGFTKKVSLLEILAGYKRKKSIPEKITDSVVKTTKKRVPLNLVWAFVKSFRVQKFYLNLDFGSAYAFAWFYPLGEIFKQENIYFTTNMEGKNNLEIQIVNRPARMFWAIFKSYLKNKKS